MKHVATRRHVKYGEDPRHWKGLDSVLARLGRKERTDYFPEMTDIPSSATLVESSSTGMGLQRSNPTASGKSKAECIIISSSLDSPLQPVQPMVAKSVNPFTRQPRIRRILESSPERNGEPPCHAKAAFMAVEAHEGSSELEVLPPLMVLA